MNKQERLKAAVLAANREQLGINTSERGAFIHGFEAGAEAEADSNLNWLVLKDMTKEQKQVFNTYPSELIICKFDNGDIIRFDEEHPFAEMIQVYFLPIE